MTQSDILNNNFNKAFECIKCSNAYDTGIVLSEEKLFKQISERKRSTFDKSKFTVVGNPAITDDGVLSKTSESTYLTIPNNIVKQLEGKKSWRIDFKGVMPDNLAYQNITGQSASSVGILNIGSINGSGNFFVQIFAEDGTNKAIYIPAGVGTNYGKSFIGYASYDGSQRYTIALSVDNGVTWVTSSDTWDKTVYFGENYLKVGYRLLTGSLDLKQFSITVDGKEVFSGNKTGIDTVTINSTDVEIPYTLSKTGSKIVDVAYRDRVIDLYEQEGQAG